MTAKTALARELAGLRMAAKLHQAQAIEVDLATLDRILSALTAPTNDEVREMVGRLRKGCSQIGLHECCCAILNEAAALIERLSPEAVRAEERERCARFVEEWNGSTKDGDTTLIAEELRELPPAIRKDAPE